MPAEQPKQWASKLIGTGVSSDSDASSCTESPCPRRSPAAAGGGG
eukprot:COSAG01_NODE_50187_length_365_cov_1.120301_1_plen_44_part_01